MIDISVNTVLVVPDHHRSELIAHAESVAPNECCGVLGGSTNGKGTVEVIRRIQNTAEHPETQYRMNPVELQETIDQIEASGYSLVGFYHSHPDGPSSPSDTDQQQAHWQGYLYVIIDLAADPAITAWVWTGATFNQVPVAVTT